jgi:hypothetical protein
VAKKRRISPRGNCPPSPAGSPAADVACPSLGASCYLLWKLVPALALPHPGPELPGARLRLPLDPLGQELDAGDKVGLLRSRKLIPAHIISAGGEVRGEGPPEAPVAGTELRHAPGVHVVAVLFTHGMAVQDGEGVTNVFLVQLRDLELCQKELRERQRSGLELETLVERNPV